MKNKICPICEKGYLRTVQEMIHAEHICHKGKIVSQFSTCDACGSEQATPEDAHVNKRTMIAFKEERMDYEDMSDFEVNASVTNLIYGIDGSEYYNQTIHDYCNNPNYAWTIIVDNEVNIEFQDGGFVNAWVDDDSGSFESQIQTNPLKAAMICFLKMKDSEK